MKIFLATDHAGFELKELIKKYFIKMEYDFEDCGAFKYDPNDDYPDFILPAAKKVAMHPNYRGIIMGGSGQGEAMAANRIKGIRATVFYDGPKDIIRLSRAHNNSNILSIGARFIDYNKVLKIIELWLSIDFDGGRHQQRINKLDC